MTTIKNLKIHLDDRGYLYETLRSDDPFFKGFGQAYISAVNPGVVKGFHKHSIQTDHIVCTSGQIKLVCIQAKGDIVIKLEEHHLSLLNPKMIIIPPETWHGWMCISNEPAVVLNFSTHTHNQLDPDEIRIDPIKNPWGYDWSIPQK